MVMFIGAWGLNWIYCGHMYFEHSKYGIASYYRDGGNVELAQEVYQRQNNYDLIYLSSYPDDLYPWIALLNNKDSQSFNQAAASRDNGDWRFENMIFRKQHCASESMIRDGFPTGKLLIVDAEGCQIAESTAKKLGLTLIKTITRPDGSPPYYLWEKSLAVAAK